MKPSSNIKEAIKNGWLHTSWFPPEEIYRFSQLKGFILDIGCGYGNNLNYFKKLKTTTKIVGIDASEEVIGKDKDIIYGDAQNLPFESNTFDGVICSEVLEHLPHPELCIKEVSRVLKMGGCAFFATPILNIPCQKIVPVYRKISGSKLKEGEHLHVFSTKKLYYKISKELQVTDIKHLGFTDLFLLVSRYGINPRSLDNSLSDLAKKIPLMNYFATTVFIRAVKEVNR